MNSNIKFECSTEPVSFAEFLKNYPTNRYEELKDDLDAYRNYVNECNLPSSTFGEINNAE